MVTTRKSNKSKETSTKVIPHKTRRSSRKPVPSTRLKDVHDHGVYSRGSSTVIKKHQGKATSPASSSASLLTSSKEAASSSSRRRPGRKKAATKTSAGSTGATGKRPKGLSAQKVTAEASGPSLGGLSSIKAAPPNARIGTNAESDNDDSLDLDNLLCFSCHKSYDFSDRDEYPLGDPLYDPCNAVLLCDNDNCHAKAYHQRCHFVPVFSIPRGEWICLLCEFENSNKKKSSKKSSKQTKKSGSVSKATSVKSEDDGSNSNDDDEALQTFLKQFDTDAGPLKAEATHDELMRLEKSIDQSLAAIRNSEHAILSYTESQRSRKSLIANFPNIPTELVNGKIRYSSSKFKIRMQLKSLERYIKDYPPRFEPRFGEKYPGQPKEEDGISLKQSAESECNTTAAVESSTTKKGQKPKSNQSAAIKSDDLTCCVCYDGEATRKNDVVMCDGNHCCRAFHMKCVRPALTVKDLKKKGQEDWFCPYCSKLAELIHHIQDELHGDDGISPHEAWKSPDDVFPEAEEEYRLSLLLKERKAPLSALFDDEVVDYGGTTATGDGHATIGDECDDDDDEDDSDHVEGLSDGNSKSDDASTSDEDEEDDEGSNKDQDETKKLLKDELEALSSAGEESTNSDDEEDDDKNKDPPDSAVEEGNGDATTSSTKKDGRRSRKRRRSAAAAAVGGSAAEKSNAVEDPGKFDVNNIIHTKRRRNPVNYTKLAGELFGNGNSKDEDSQYAQMMMMMDDDEQESDYEEGNMSKASKNNGSKSASENNVQLEKNIVEDSKISAAPMEEARTTTAFYSNTASGIDHHAYFGGVISAAPNRRATKMRAPRGSKREDNLTCTCKKSRCLKLYCVCFAREIECNERCRCVDCKNGKPPPQEEKDDSGEVGETTATPTANAEDLLLALKNTTTTGAAGPPPLALSAKLEDSTETNNNEDGLDLLLSLKTEGSSRKDLASKSSDREASEGASGAARSTMKIRTTDEEKSGAVVKCNCSKSNCLKLYCPCLANGTTCTDEYCSCHECSNDRVSTKKLPSSNMAMPKVEEEEDEEEMPELPSLNVNNKKYSNDMSVNSHHGNNDRRLMGRKFGQELKTEGCNCKKSKCLKLYCVCYSNGLRCSRTCLCKDCSNKGPILGSTTTAKDAATGRSPNSIKKVSPSIPVLSTPAAAVAAAAPPLTLSLLGPATSEKTKAALSSDPQQQSNCACKHSRCLKKYCICFSKAVHCNSLCTCYPCMNKPHTATDDDNGNNFNNQMPSPSSIPSATALGSVAEEMISSGSKMLSSRQSPSRGKKTTPTVVQNNKGHRSSNVKVELASSSSSSAVAVGSSSAFYGEHYHHGRVAAASSYANGRGGDYHMYYRGSAGSASRGSSSPRRHHGNVVGCSCKLGKGSCLRMYCPCFYNSRLCSSDSCRCEGCSNYHPQQMMRGPPSDPYHPPPLPPSHSPTKQHSSSRYPYLPSHGIPYHGTMVPPTTSNISGSHTGSTGSSTTTKERKAASSSSSSSSPISKKKNPSSQIPKATSPEIKAMSSMIESATNASSQQQPSVSLASQQLAATSSSSASAPTAPPPDFLTCDTCSCKKSKCIARYCQCYASGIRCKDTCTCNGCLNKEKEPPTSMMDSKQNSAGTLTSNQSLETSTKEQPKPATGDSSSKVGERGERTEEGKQGEHLDKEKESKPSSNDNDQASNAAAKSKPGKLASETLPCAETDSKATESEEKDSTPKSAAVEDQQVSSGLGENGSERRKFNDDKEGQDHDMKIKPEEASMPPPLTDGKNNGTMPSKDHQEAATKTTSLTASHEESTDGELLLEESSRAEAV